MSLDAYSDDDLKREIARREFVRQREASRMVCPRCKGKKEVLTDSGFVLSTSDPAPCSMCQCTGLVGRVQ
jgi:hypothetical protein